MPRGKLRSPEEIGRMVKDIKRMHRPLLRQIEILQIRERTLDWVMGGDDAFIEPEPDNAGDGALDISDDAAEGVSEQ
jgi:hypothetical protein